LMKRERMCAWRDGAFRAITSRCLVHTLNADAEAMEFFSLTETCPALHFH
jgi:hypothetical protein